MRAGYERPPLRDVVRVRAEVDQVVDPELERWLGHWLRRVLQAKSTPDSAR